MKRSPAATAGGHIGKLRRFVSATCILIMFHEPEVFILIDTECNAQVGEIKIINL